MKYQKEEILEYFPSFFIVKHLKFFNLSLINSLTQVLAALLIFWSALTVRGCEDRCLFLTTSELSP